MVKDKGGESSVASTTFSTWFEQGAAPTMAKPVESNVYLVGAGPGDPELLTLKALRLIREADVIVYDRLVSTSILEMIPPGTGRIFVGKESGCHPVPQSDINELLVQLARVHQKVVRLKGGDPTIFGRGCEEGEYLVSRGIGFEIVPGITAASGCAAVAGVPLTHRAAASGVRFVTGHRLEGRSLDLNWQSLADPDTTLVVYMGLAQLGEIASRLIEAGLPGTTPAIAISKGTTAGQDFCRATLADLPHQVSAAGLPSPTLIIIGKVVAISDRLRETSEANDFWPTVLDAEAGYA